MKKIGVQYLFLVCVLIAATAFSGCHILDGGMSSVDPPSLSEPYPDPKESVLNDLAPVRPRDMMISENDNQADKS